VYYLSRRARLPGLTDFASGLLDDFTVIVAALLHESLAQTGGGPSGSVTAQLPASVVSRLNTPVAGHFYPSLRCACAVAMTDGTSHPCV